MRATSCGRPVWPALALAAGLILALLAPLAEATSGADLPPCRNLVANGDFEASPAGTGWVLSANPPLGAGESLVDDFFPHDGNLGAYLGGRDNATDSVSQQVVLPSGVSSLPLKFWWARQTEEQGAMTDTLKVSLYQADGITLIADIVTYSNEDATDNYVWSPGAFDLVAYAGQTVVLRFTALTDVNLPTSFFVDDVSIGSSVGCVGTYLPMIVRKAH